MNRWWSSLSSGPHFGGDSAEAFQESRWNSRMVHLQSCLRQCQWCDGGDQRGREEADNRGAHGARSMYRACRAKRPSAFVQAVRIRPRHRCPEQGLLEELTCTLSRRPAQPREIVSARCAGALDRAHELGRAVGLREEALELAAQQASLDGDVEVPGRDDDGDARDPRRAGGAAPRRRRGRASSCPE